jgi:pyridoxal phosphate enzyme (YggS family)
MKINERLTKIRGQIAAAAQAAGRRPEDIRLIAVSKTQPPEAVEEAYQQGQRVFGENYADELILKSSQLQSLPGIYWVFIGQLQSNKIQKIVTHADEIQSIATEKHARYVQRYAEAAGKTGFPVWIITNSAEEESKQGVPMGDVAKLASFIDNNCPNLALQGLMAIPPSSISDETASASAPPQPPNLYRDLRNIADSTGLGKLSLGMTGDLGIAIASGSDCIRIGTAIFGPREKKSTEQGPPA